MQPKSDSSVRTQRWNHQKLALRTTQARCQALASNSEMRGADGRCKLMGSMFAGEHLCYVHALLRREGRAKLAG